MTFFGEDMTVVCKNCGTEYNDPGGDLSKYHCDKCAVKGPLIRFRKRKKKKDTDQIIGTGAGVAVGAALAGIAGAIVVGCLIWGLWKATKK